MTRDLRLMEIERTPYKDGSTKYDTTFENDDFEVKTETWTRGGDIVVTFPNQMPTIELAREAERYAERVVKECETFDWLFPLVEHAVDIAEAMYRKWDGTNRESAVSMAIQDSEDDRDYYADIPDDIDRPDVNFALTQCFEREL